MGNEMISFFDGAQKAIMDGVDTVNRNVVGGNIQLQNQMLSLGKQVEAGLQQLNNRMESYTTERKRLMGRQLVYCSDGTLSVVRIMSDGSQTSVPFITSTIGTCMIADVFVDVIGPWADYCIMEFENAAIQILGKKKKFSGKWLYEEFVKAGIRFNPELSKGFIMDMLFEAFAQAINNPPRKIVISSKAGWDAGVFRDFTNYPLKTPDYSELPVYRKSFCRREATERDYAVYFESLRQITRWEDRIMIMVPLYTGLVASLLSTAGMAIDYLWNFVMMEDMPSSRLASWLQIYNRGSWKIHDADISNKKLNALLTESKDEVLIMDFQSIPTDNSYMIQKKRDVFWEIRKKLQLELFPLVVVAISDTVALGKNIFNIFVDRDFFYGDMTEKYSETHKSLDAIMADFVSYIEKNYDKIINKEFFEIGKSISGDFVELETVWKLLCKFFDCHNYNVYEALDIPENFSWNALAEMSEWEEENLLELFVRKFRKAVGGIYFKEKCYGQAFETESTILHDENYIWIPVSVWNRILKECGLDDYKRRILMELNDRGYLKTDATGYSKKIHTGNQSHEVYQISKSFFNCSGYSDVTSCGKED